MAEPSVLLWDIGGVLLSNGFDEGSRSAAAATFGFDPAEFERRYHTALGPFERGKMTLDGFLDQLLFYTDRPFGRDRFKEFLFRCSSPHPEVIEIARAAANGAGRRSVAFNNESRELNEYRIRTFGLDRFLSAFFSSCYTGLRKPEPEAYRLVIDVLAASPDRVVFIDDRAENLAPASALGVQTIQYRSPAALRADLGAAGVRW